MTRAETAALVASAWLGLSFALHRLRLHRRRRSGPSLESLGRFDYRALFEAALPEGVGPGPGASAPGSDNAVAPEAYRVSPWELDRPPALAGLRDQLRVGGSPSLEVGDPRAAWLAWHFAVRRVLGGDLDGAADLARWLGPRRAEPMLAAIDLARSERRRAARDLAGAREAAQAALRRAERVRPGTPSLEYLRAHVQLVWLTHPLNLELSVGRALLRLSRAQRHFGERPWLCLAQAHAHALLGRHEEALDGMARALYHARADPFYARPILEGEFVQRARPALWAQCLAARASSLELGRSGPGG